MDKGTVQEGISRMESVVEDYYNTVDKLKNEYQKAAKNVYPDRESKMSKLDGIKQQAKAEQESFRSKLENTYQKEKEKIQKQVGFGEGDPDKTTGAIQAASKLNKQELRALAGQFKAENNYIGLRQLKEVAKDKEITLNVEFSDIGKQIESINKRYKGLQKRFSENPLQDNKGSLARKAMGL